MKARGLEPDVRRRTGLPVDAYFSATKLRWLLDHVPDGQSRAENGELLFGTVDSWLIWKLTGGATHVTDATNASRTMLLNLDDLAWDRDMLRELDIPTVMLPKIVNSSGVCSVRNRGPVSRPRDADCRYRRRPEDGAVRAGLLHARFGEEHVRDRLLRADEHRPVPA